MKTLAGGFAALMGNVLSGSGRAADTASAVARGQWTYEGVTGPEHWSELSPDYAACQFGVRQSPIDLVDASKLIAPGTLVLDYRPVTAKTLQEPSGLRIALDPGCFLEHSGQIYALEEFRFRRPSEHLLSGRALEMEMQFLHRALGGNIAITGVFIRQGAENAAISAILASVSASSQPPESGSVFPLDPARLMPPFANSEDHRAFYSYTGSMTEPPCSEGIRWIVFKTPCEASPEQIRALASLFPRNARPAQPLNTRTLLEYGGQSASVSQ